MFPGKEKIEKRNSTTVTEIRTYEYSDRKRSFL